MNLKNRLHPEIFARKWNLAANFKAACKAVGLKPKSAAMKASLYRTRYAVPLQMFQDRREEIDWGRVRNAALVATEARVNKKP